MCKRFGESLNKAINICQRDGDNSRFYENPFVYAFNEIKKECLGGIFEVSEKFKEKYFSTDDSFKYFGFEITEGETIPTEWYKLAYYYTRYYRYDYIFKSYEIGNNDYEMVCSNDKKSTFQYCIFTDTLKPRKVFEGFCNTDNLVLYNRRIEDGYWLHCELIKDLYTTKRYWEPGDDVSSSKEIRFFSTIFYNNDDLTHRTIAHDVCDNNINESKRKMILYITRMLTISISKIVK